MTKGWRLGCMRSDSGRLRRTRTGLPQQQGEQGGMALHGHVLLAAEAAAVGHLDDPHLFLGQAQQRGHLAPVLIDSLALRIETHAALFGQGDRGLGLQEGVLDHLGAEHA